MKSYKLFIGFMTILTGIISAAAQPETVTFGELWRLEGVKTGIWDNTGDRIAVAGASGGLHLYDTRSGKLLQSLTETEIEDYPTLSQVAWSPNNRFLAARLNLSDKIWVWDTISGQHIYTLLWRDSPLAFTPDGSFLTGMSGYGQIQVWDSVSGSLEQTLREKRLDYQSVRFFSWSPNGKLILFGQTEGASLSVFDFPTKTVRFRTHLTDGKVRQGGWTPDGNVIYAVSQSFTLYRWTAADAVPLKPFFVGGGMVSFSPDGRYFAANYQSFPYDDNPPPWNVVYIYDAQTLERVGQIDHPEVDDYINWLAWSPDGERIATVTTNGNTLRVWQRVTP